MKKSMKILAFISAFSLFALPMTFMPYEYTNISATEEDSTNNTKATATEINTNTVVTENITSSSDANWYKINLEADGYISVDIEHDTIENASNFWTAEIYQSDGTNLIYNFSVTGNNALTSSPSIGLSAGDYFIKIRPYSAYPWSDLDLQITVNYTADDFHETEDNDTKNNADIIDFNTEYTGSNMNYSDNDWYKFTVDKTGYIDISFTHDTIDNSNNYWDINVYKKDGTTLINGTAIKGTTEVTNLPLMSLEEGEYYIKITTRTSYYSSNMDYIFSVNFEESDSWETETNNTKAEANEILENTMYHGTIMNQNDADYYKLTLTEDKVLDIDFEHDTVDEDNFWNISIYDSDGTTIIYAFTSQIVNAITKSSSISLPAGEYYIKVNSTNYYSTIEYQFTVNSTVNENWEIEVNNSKNTANTIDVNTVYNSNIMSGSDTDWFTFTTDESGYISLDFEHDTIENTTTYWIAEIYQSDATTLIHSLNIAGDNMITKTPTIGLPAGDYFVKIKPASTSTYKKMNIQFNINYTATDLWETESNNTKLTSNDIVINEKVGGSLMTDSDTDWYKFDVDEDQKLKIIFEHPGVNNTTYDYWNVSVYESDGTTLIKSVDVSGETTETTIEETFAKGTYYIKIKLPSFSYYYATKDYNIIVSDDVTMKGDVDLDDSITSNDALMILQMVTGLIEATDDIKSIADVNSDSAITSVDALTILQYIVGSIETL